MTHTPSTPSASSTTGSLSPTHNHRNGLLAGLACYVMWGCLPFYFSLVSSAGPLEILAHRIVWSLVFCLVLLLITRRIKTFLRVFSAASLVRALTIATVLILINWLTYLYAVTSEHVLDASLGYYINPLITVLLAVIVLREHASPLKWVALGLGTTAVIVMTIGMGRLPWISIVLAGSFGFYGLVKNRVGSKVDAIVSLSVETALATSFALIFLVWLGMRGDSTFTSEGGGHTFLLLLAGVITALPLIFFGYAARNLPLTMLGMLQYLAPTIQFLFGIFLFHEPMPLSRWIGFAFVWLAVAVFAYDAVRSARATALARA